MFARCRPSQTVVDLYCTIKDDLHPASSPAVKATESIELESQWAEKIWKLGERVMPNLLQENRWAERVNL
jgi:hypothetical protein